MSMMVETSKVLEIRHEALRRLVEIGDHTGCEAASARSFQEGRLDALKRLGLDTIRAEVATDEEIRKRRLDLDDALRERGKSRPDRDPLLAEPIARRDEPDFRAASEFWGIPEEQLRRLPVHEPDCSLVTTHHLTCTCGAYRRSMTEPESTEEVVEAATEAEATNDEAAEAEAADDAAEDEDSE